MDTKQEQIDAARNALGEFNSDCQTLEWCVKDIRRVLGYRCSENERLAKSLRDCRGLIEESTLESERLKKNLIEANQEITSMKKVIRKYKLSAMKDQHS